jgi:serine/threonine protein kinase/tetratricopeptide (TPR) repeat protein
MKCPKCQFDNPSDTYFCGKCGAKLSFDRGHELSSPESDAASPNLQTETLQAPVRELATGASFAGRYQVIEELGKGGMGKVYKVLDTSINEKIALKLLKPEIAADRETIERFSNELKFARKIRHKNVCQMFDLGKAEGAPFITMEYVAGEDLKSMIRMSKRLSIGTAVGIAKQISEGLAEAHALGVVHRDLKPSNIMIDKDGNVRIMDFGIARSLKGKGITGAGVMIGTPEYMSPEQIEGKEVDQRTDIYSLGVIIYEMVTDRVPFEGDTPFTIGVKHKSEMPKNPREVNPQIPEDLSGVILRCLEKDKEKRYQNAADVRIELEKIEQGLPTTDRIIPKKKGLTSKEITVKFNVKKILIPALVFLTLVVAAVLIWRFIPKKETAPAVTATAKKSIAVLPFEDLSAGKDQEPLADGIPETLINSLSSIEGLHVSARTSSFSFKGKQQDIREIGQKLGVESLLEGSIQVAGNKLRIMVRLINIANGFPIWSQDYNKTMDDVFSIQDDIAQSVVKALKIKLLGEKEEQLVKSYTASREAYNFYLQGRYFWEKRGKEDVERAVEFFNKAIEKDQTYALAYAGIADSYDVLGDNLLIPSNEAFPKAKAAALKALEINDGLAEAHVSLASILDHEHNFSRAEKEYKIAIELNPGYATAHHWYALFLSYQGRHDEAIKEILQARELDPLSPRINANVGYILYNARRYDQAIGELKKSAGLFPEHATNYGYAGYVYALTGRYEEALSAFNHALELEASAGEFILWPAYCYARSGKQAEAQKLLERFIEYSKKNFVSATEIALVYTGLNDKEQAFIWLDKAFSENDALLSRLKVDPAFDPLLSDPRFTALLRKIGFEK